MLYCGLEGATLYTHYWKLTFRPLLYKKNNRVSVRISEKSGCASEFAPLGNFGDEMNKKMEKQLEWTGNRIRKPSPSRDDRRKKTRMRKRSKSRKKKQKEEKKKKQQKQQKQKQKQKKQKQKEKEKETEKEKEEKKRKHKQKQKKQK